jgi:glutamate-1-semialdehyde 2,1-aminomutase
MRPDLVTYGKVIGGGFPVACYGGRKDLMEMVAPVGAVYQAGTLSANPVGMRAGLATLQKIESADVYAKLEERTGRFCDELNSEFRGRDFPLQLERAASIFWLHARTDEAIRRIDQIPAHHAGAFAKVFHRALSRGIYLAPSGFEVSFMSLAHSDELLGRAREAILAAVEDASASNIG